MRLHRTAFVAASVLVLTCAPGLIATAAPSVIDTEVTVGSDDTYFSHNKQNEPGVAVNPVDTAMCRRGRERQHRLGALQRGRPADLPVHPGRRSVRRAVLDRRRHDLDPADLHGLLGPQRLLPARRRPHHARLYPDVGADRHAAATTPKTAWSPTATPSLSSARGQKRWLVLVGQRARLYYANIATPSSQASTGFNGDAAIAVSRTDDLEARWPARTPAGADPVIVTKQNAALFSDKEQIWADNAASSPYFGNVYVCNVGFRGTAGSEPVLFARSTDGGDSWSTRQLTPATNNGQTGGRQGCAIRTDSDRRRVRRLDQASTSSARPDVFYQTRSFDGGQQLRAAAADHRCRRHRAVRSGAGTVHHRRSRRGTHQHLPEHRHRQRRTNRRRRHRRDRRHLVRRPSGHQPTSGPT